MHANIRTHMQTPRAHVPMKPQTKETEASPRLGRKEEEMHITVFINVEQGYARADTCISVSV